MATTIQKYIPSCFLILAIIALAGCAATDQPPYVRKGPPPPPVSAQAPLTVMTFNIRLGLGQGNPRQDILRMRSQWGRNLGNVIEAIRSKDPDIVGLQEVANPGQLRQIAQALDMNHFFVWHETGTTLKPYWGVGLLSKYPIKSSLRAALSDDRNFIVATIKVRDRLISVANIHRSHHQFGEESLPILLGEMRQIRLPTLLLGDFNVSPNARMLRNRNMRKLQPILNDFQDTAVSAGTESAKQARVVGTGQNGRRIDYVFVEKSHFDVLDAGLVASRHRKASKHIAYFTELKFSK